MGDEGVIDPERSHLGLELHKIISRLSRENGDPGEMATLGEAMARLQLLERAIRDLLVLTAKIPDHELHLAIRQAREVIGDQ